MQPRVHCPLHGYHSHALSNNNGIPPKVDSQDFRKLYAMGHNLRPGHHEAVQKHTLVLTSPAIQGGTKTTQTQHSPAASAWCFSQIQRFWQSTSAFQLFLAAGKAQERKGCMLEHMSTPKAENSKKWGITALSIAGEKIRSLICDWKSHFFFCSSSNKTRGIE